MSFTYSLILKYTFKDKPYYGPPYNTAIFFLQVGENCSISIFFYFLSKNVY